MTDTFSAKHFHDEAAAYRFVEARVWADGRVCPHCGTVDNSTALKGASTRPGVYKCKDCRKPFTVKVGTVFEGSNVKLHIWLQAMHLLCSSKKGFSSNQLHRTLGVTLKTAWFMSHRIREAMKDNALAPIGGSGVTLEVDETFWGQQATVFVNGKGWQRRRGGGDMQKIVTLVERGGRARSVHVASLQKNEVIRAMATADRASILHTDQAQHYRRIGKEFTAHESVDHGRHEYVRGDVTTNTVEGFFSIFKRGLKGVYQHCNERHLHRYAAEFDFRYSERVALGVDDAERAGRALEGIVGKRLKYRVSSGAVVQ